MAQYHFPSKYLWVQGLKTGNPFLWNPYSSLGGPFLANPNIFAYTPFNLLFLILPVSYAFTWTFFFHFLLSALGTYLFVRSLGAGWKGAFLSGMAYSFSSFFVAHLQAGHPTVIWTASWIPLSLFFLSLFLERQQSRFLFAAAGATSLGILEGHPQISMYSFLICGFYMVWYWLRGKLSGKKIILSIFGFFIFSLILAACQLVPTTEFAKLSDRWTWSYSNIMCDYTSPENLIYFLKPFYRGSPLNGTYSGPWGYHELATYIGLVPIFLAVVGLVFLKRRPVIGCFWFLSALFTVLSMGDSTSFSHHVFKFFYDFVPGFGHNRSVGRIMILTLFCLACVAGLALDEWSKFWKNKNLQSVGTRFLLITGIPLLLIVVTMADLWNYDRGFIQIESGDDFFSKTLIFPADMTELIQGDKSYPRVQPGSQNSSEHILKIYQLETSTMFTMMIKEVSQYIVAVENHYDSPLSDLIALKYVYYPDLFQHPTDRWKPFKYGAVINSKMLPHAYVVGGYDMVPNPTQAIELIQDNHFDIRTGVLLEKRPADDVAWNKGWMGEAIITHYGENEVDFTCQTDRRGIFFFSDPYYPGWKAWVDGKEKHIFRADGVFRAVVIDGPGNHQIRMSFQPLSVYLPFVFSIFAWFLLMLGFLFPKKSAELFKVMIQWMGPKT
jgi:hypothetical protein